MDELIHHGDLDRLELERLGISSSALVDVSVNVSPFGPHLEVVRAIREASLHVYPDRRALDARAALSVALDVDPAGLILGNGAAELIWTVLLASRASGGPLLVVGPTFSEPVAAATALGVAVVRVDMDERAAFEVDATVIERAIDACSPSLVYVCHPNNPTGRAMPTARLCQLVASRPGTVFLVDQAFLSLSSMHVDQAIRFPSNAVVLRSMTKDHALAGVRVAYAITTPSRVRLLEAARASWTVSSLAQAAICAAVLHPEHVTAARTAMLAWRRAFTMELTAIGLAPIPSETAYLVVRTGDADGVRERLLVRHGILARSGASFGMPEHLRLAARDQSLRARVVRALSVELGA